MSSRLVSKITAVVLILSLFVPVIAEAVMVMSPPGTVPITTGGNTVLIPWDKILDDSQTATLGTLTAGLTVYGSDFIHASQSRSDNYSVYLPTNVNGEVQLALVDALGGIVALGQPDMISNYNYHSSALYPVSSFVTGEYTLRVLVDGTYVEGAHPITVIDNTLIKSVSRKTVGGKYSVYPGDTELYLDIEAYGVEEAAELQLALLDGDAVVATATAGIVGGKTGDGRTQLVYQLTFLPGLSFAANNNYVIEVSRSDSGPIQSTGAEPVAPNTIPDIYRVEVIDGGAGLVALHLANVPAGIIQVEVSYWDSISMTDRILQTAVPSYSYNGGGVIPIQIVDKHGTPMVLEGYYYLRLLQGTTQIVGIRGFDLGGIGDYYPQAVLLSASPGTLLGLTPQQTVEVRASIANINEQSTPSIELITVDSEGKPTGVVASATNVNLMPSNDPYRYRFDNQFDVSGTITVSNLPMGNYRWRITVQNKGGDERVFVPAKPVQVVTGPCYEKLTIHNGLAPHHHHMGGEEGPTFFIGTNQARVDFSLEGAFLIADLNKLDVEVVDAATETVVGSLHRQSLVRKGEDIAGSVVISTPLVDEQEYLLVVSYDNALLPQSEEQLQTMDTAAKLNISSVSGAPGSGEVGSTAQVLLSLDNLSSLGIDGVAGFDLELVYNSSLVNLVESGSITAGVGLGREAVFEVNAQYASGKARIAAAASEATISGELAMFTFALQESGTAALSVEKLKLYNSDGSLITGVIAGSGSIMIAGESGPAELGSVTLIASSLTGMQSISLDWPENTFMSTGTPFELRLMNIMNLNPAQVRVILQPIAGGTKLECISQGVQMGNDLVLTSTPPYPLLGWHALSIEHDGNPLNQLYIAGYSSPPTIESYPIDDFHVYFTEKPYVRATGQTEQGFDFYGGGFAEGKQYQLALYKMSDPVGPVSLYQMTISNPRTLFISRDALAAQDRGQYYAYILVDGVAAPFLHPLALTLRSDEQVVRQPSVTINNGASTTVSRDVKLNINPGSFKEVRFANSEAELATLSYQSITGVTVFDHQLTLGAGSKTVYLQFRDGDSTVSIPVSIVRAATAPTVSINDGASKSYSRKVTIKVGSTTFGEMRVANSEAELATLPYVAVTSTSDHMLTAGVGTKAVFVQFREEDLTATVQLSIERVITEPTVTINSSDPSSNDAVFTFSRAVVLNIKPGTYAEVKWANSESGLTSATYQTVGSPLPVESLSLQHILSDGFGPKTVYFRFKDLDGVETAVMSKSINYVNKTLPLEGHGISKNVFGDGQRVTMWINSSHAPVAASVEFYKDGATEPFATHALARTNVASGVSTYSKAVTIDSSYQGVEKAVFKLVDPSTTASGSAEVEVKYENKIYISYSSTFFEWLYLRDIHIKKDSQVNFSVYGSPGMTATALVHYTKNGQDLVETYNLTETVGWQGQYTSQGNVPAGAAVVEKVVYQLKSVATGLEEERLETVNRPIAPSVTFTGLPNNTGVFNGLTLTLENTVFWSRYQLTVSANNPLAFTAVNAGTYNYTLSDGRRIYAKDTFTVTAGEEKTIDLSQSNAPASLELKILGEKNIELAATAGRVRYDVVKADDGQTMVQFLNLNQKLTGLVVGDNVTCTITLYSEALQTYTLPTATTVLLDTSNKVEEIALQTIPRVTISGVVIDQARDKDAGGNDIEVPLEGVAVRIYQYLNNGGVWVYNNMTATTNARGEFSVSAFRGVGGNITVVKEGFIGTTIFLIPNDTLEESRRIVELAYRDTSFININALVAPALRAGEEAPESGFVPTQSSNVSRLTVHRNDDNHTPINGWYYSYMGRFYISADQGLSANDTVIIKAIGGNGLVVVPEQQAGVEVQLSRHITTTADIKLVDRGHISANPENSVDPLSNVYMLVFDSTGWRVGYYVGVGELTTASTNLPNGQYTVVFLSGSNLQKVQRIGRLNALGNEGLGLIPDVHYVRMDNVTIAPQVITDLGEFAVPTVTDADLGYLSIQGTSISLGRTEVTSDGTILATINIRYQLASTAMTLGHTVESLNVDLSGAKIYKDEYFINGQRYVTGQGASYISKALVAADRQQGVITFIAELNDETTLNVSSRAQIRTGHVSISEQIGSETFALPAINIIAPEQVRAGDDVKITVRGVARPNSAIAVVANEVEVGNTTTDTRGKWQATVSLVNAKDPGSHSLQARASFDVNGVAEEVYSNIAYTQVLHVLAPVVDEIKVWQPVGSYNLFTLTINVGEDNLPRVLSINPSYPVYARFKILNVNPEDVDYAAFVNTYRGNSTLYDAVYIDDPQSPDFGYWRASGYLRQPGKLSAFYSLKEELGVSYITGSTPIDVTDLPSQPRIDPASLPPEIRNAGVVVHSDGSNTGGNTANLSATLDLGDGISIQFTGTHSEVTVAQVPSNFIKLNSNQGAFWNAAPKLELGIGPGGRDIRITKTIYFERDLFEAVVGLTDQSLSSMGLTVTESSELTALSGVLDKVDYVSYVSGGVDFVVSTSKNPDALGRLGTGMTVLGGVSTAANAMFGRIGLDPAEMRRMAAGIEDPVYRKRMYDEIDEYASATSTSHRINSLIGGVSYGASFFGPLGKGLSWVVSTGGQVFGKKIGSEYEVWSDALIRMIKLELERQARNKKKGGKDDPINDPLWKIDPSGYVFEATEEQRIEGIRATVLEKGADGVFREWADAEDYGEVNPQYTSDMGKYGWDVPEGDWKVRFEDTQHSIYLSTETKSITVPPLHDQVNIGLLSTAAPQIKANGVAVYPGGVEIEFDMFMLPSSFGGRVVVSEIDDNGNPLLVVVSDAATPSNIILRDANGDAVPVKEVVLLDWVRNSGYVADAPYSEIVIPATHFARKIRVVPDLPTGSFNLFAEGGGAASYEVSVAANVASYASVPMGVALAPQSFEVQSLGVSVSGTVSFVSPAGVITSEGAVVTIKQGAVTIGTTTTAADGTYTFDSIDAGEYTITVNKSKFATIVKTLQVLVGEPQVVNLTTALLGDVNLDGHVNAADIVPINRHALGIELITNELMLLAADVNNDTHVNAADIVPVNRHALGIELIQ